MRNVDKKISNTILWVLSLSVLLGLVAFTEYKNKQQVCERISAKIVQGTKENGTKENIYFIEKENVKDIITYNGREPIEDTKLIHIDVFDVEKRVKMDKFVKDVEVFKTLKGELKVKVTQRRPIARFIRSDSSFYVSNQGVFLPMSNRYSARVILVRENGKTPYFLGSELTSDADFALYELLSVIEKDEFLNKIVSEIILKEDGQVWIRPQVSRQIIIWGLPVDTESKRERLMKVYQNILPSKGWNKYQRINLSFKNQIICE